MFIVLRKRLPMNDTVPSLDYHRMIYGLRFIHTNDLCTVIVLMKTCVTCTDYKNDCAIVADCPFDRVDFLQW